MSENSEHVKNWRRNTKQRIVDAFNSRCGTCGYDKCVEALELHHLDPKEKEFSFGAIRANPVSWEKIIIEMRKCVLLCANCHREVHNNNREITQDCPRFNENYADYKSNKRKELTDNCPICNGEKSCHQITCSKNCAAKKRCKVDWEKYDLHDLFVTKRLPRTKIATIVGCSDVSVKKRLIKLNIQR
jgi:hypothetical protein